MTDTDSQTVASLEPAQPTLPGPGTKRRLSALMWVVALAVVALDQLTKAWALNALAGLERQPLIGSLLGLRLVFNPGAALSLATGQTWVLTVVAFVVVVAVVWVSRRLGSTGWAFVLGLVLGGATGNLVDRLVRPPGVGQGHVVDFIDYGVFVGNVADIAIVLAAVLIMGLSLTGRELSRGKDVLHQVGGPESPQAIPAAERVPGSSGQGGTGSQEA